MKAATAPPQRFWLRIRLVADRVVAALALVVLSPVIAVIAAAIRILDGPPAFVRVTRMGRGFQPFEMWKLRSMRPTQENGRAGGAPLTAENDDRVTPIGRRLRAYHLDELPQLWNVAKGEMLLLGPRPETPEYVDPEDPRWQTLMQVPPGIAGPTQLVVSEWERRMLADNPMNGVYPNKVLPVKLAIDEWYVETSSPTRDAEVSVALVKRFLPGSQATRMRKRIYSEVPISLTVRHER